MRNTKKLSDFLKVPFYLVNKLKNSQKSFLLKLKNVHFNLLFIISSLYWENVMSVVQQLKLLNIEIKVI